MQTLFALPLTEQGSRRVAADEKKNVKGLQASTGRCSVNNKVSILACSTVGSRVVACLPCLSRYLISRFRVKDMGQLDRSP